MIRRLFKRKTNFLLFAEVYIEDNKHLYSLETIRTYTTQISKMQKFKDIVYIEDIDLNFLYSYQKYMIVKLRNKPNTYYKSLSWIKTMLNNAVRNGVIKSHSAFANFPIRKLQGNRANLTVQELERLTRYYEQTERKGARNVLQYFLFSCYTGLRFTDIANLKNSNIVNGIIQIQQHKTNSLVKVPLSKKAIQFAELEDTKPYVFKIISNQKTNKHLKRIASECRINKDLTFHVARHTFATLGLTLGIPIEIVSKLLGHTDIKTTQIYAKVRDDLLIKEMRKFDNL